MNTPTYKSEIKIPDAPVKIKRRIENEIDNFIPSNLKETFDMVKTISFNLKRKNKILNTNSSFFVEEVDANVLITPVKSKRLLDVDHTPYDFEKKWKSDDDIICCNLDYSEDNDDYINMCYYKKFNYYEYDIN